MTRKTKDGLLRRGNRKIKRMPRKIRRNKYMKTETENWETKFDEKFFQNPDGEKIAGWLAMKNGVYFEEKECSKIANPNDVKSFIRQLLQEARVEERGKIRRAISKMPISKTIGQILSLPELSVNPPQK